MPTLQELESYAYRSGYLTAQLEFAHVAITSAIGRVTMDPGRATVELGRARQQIETALTLVAAVDAAIAARLGLNSGDSRSEARRGQILPDLPAEQNAPPAPSEA